MNTDTQNIIDGKKINIEMLIKTAEKPELFSTGEKLFWNDPHISKKMLEAHLDPSSDAASRRPETIDKMVEWLVKRLGLGKGSKILDIGCGPGLYCTRLHSYGVEVVGMDYSENSLNYARKYAQENRLDIRYIYQDYLTMDFTEEFDAIFLIWCDFGVLSDKDRDLLLQKIKKALKPGGVFVFDVFTANIGTPVASSWYACESGFWRPDPYIELDQVYHYEEENVYLDQHIIIDCNGKVKVYKIWNRYYSVETVSRALKAQGFRIADTRSDLAGKPYEESTEMLGILAEKPK